MEYKLGLQLHAVREGFAEDPLGTLKRVAEMGYGGVEFNFFAMNRGIEEYQAMFAEAGVECYGCLTSWTDILPENLERTLSYMKALNCKTLVIGSVDFGMLNEDPDYARKVVEQMKNASEVMKKEGIMSGYHAHDADFTNKVGDVTFYEYVMQNTPQDFMMVLDTGNIQAGGGDPIEMLRKFPGRTPTAHIKGYGQADGYTTPVWESELDWDVFFPLVLDCGAQIFDIEFGKRGDYEPFERAALSAKWLKEQIEKYGR